MKPPDPGPKPENPRPAMERLTKHFGELQDRGLLRDWAEVTKCMAWLVKNANDHAERLKSEEP